MLHGASRAPVHPGPSHTPITFHKAQRRHARRPINQFPWKDCHLRITSQGYVIESDWAMTTFDNRTDDQFFDTKRLQTIDEDTEVLFFQPFNPLNYSSDCVNFDVLQEGGRLDQHEQEGLVRRLYVETKSALAQIELRARNLCCHLLGRIQPRLTLYPFTPPLGVSPLVRSFSFGTAK